MPSGLQQGDRVSLTCSVFKGNRPLELSWHLPLPPSSSGRHQDHHSAVKPIRIDEFTSMLTISSLSLRHNGNYTCRAVNSAGHAQFSQRIQVNGNRLTRDVTRERNNELRAAVCLGLQEVFQTQGEGSGCRFMMMG